MDPETNLDAVRNVGINDGIIAAITEDQISGTETIDASGHVVAPGFIDSQQHGHGNIWSVKVGLRDGVTTPLDLEFGNMNVAQWYADREGNWPANYGAAVSHEIHRMSVLDGMNITEPVDAKDALARLRGASLR